MSSSSVTALAANGIGGDHGTFEELEIGPRRRHLKTERRLLNSRAPFLARGGESEDHDYTQAVT